MAETKETILIEIKAKTDKVDALKKSIADLKDENKLLQQQQKELNKLYEKGEISLAEYEKRNNNIQYVLQDNTDAIKQNNDELKKANTELNQNKRYADAASGSIEQLRAESILLTRELEKMTEAERENSERGKQLKKQLSDVNNTIAEFSIETKNGTDLFSRYTVGIQRALPFLGQYTQAISGFKEAFKNASDGIKSGINGLKSFKVALAATGIGLLITAIATLIQYFTKTEAGAKVVQKVMAAIGAVIDTLIGRVATFGKGLFQILSGDFSKGIDTLKGSFVGLGDAISKSVDEAQKLNDLKNGFKTLNRQQELLIANLEKTAEIQAKIADDDTRSFAERKAADSLARKASDEALQARLKIATANEDIAKKELDIAVANNKANDDIRDAANDAEIARIEAEKNIEMATLESTERRKKILRDEFEQRLDFTLDIYDNDKKNIERRLKDESLSAKERLSLLNEIKEADLRNQQEITDLYEKQTGKKIDINALLKQDNIALLNDQIQNGLQLNEIEANRLREVIIERQNYNQDIVELEKELQAALAEVPKIENKEIDTTEEDDFWEKETEKQALLTELTAQSELKKLEIERDARLKKAEEVIQDETELANARLMIEEDYATKVEAIEKAKNEAILASTAGILGDIGGLFKENTIASKLAASAQALINTYLGATAAFAQTPGGIVIKTIAAGTAVASGLASVAKINGIKAEKGLSIKGKRHSEGGELIEAESGEVVINRRSVAMFLPQLSEINKAGGGVPLMANGGSVGTTSFVSNNIMRNTEQNTRVVERQTPVLVLRDVDDIRSNQMNELQIETD